MQSFGYDWNMLSFGHYEYIPILGIEETVWDMFHIPWPCFGVEEIMWAAGVTLWEALTTFPF